MGKIRITRPQSTGTYLYGSQRKHNSFVSITIELGGAGDHHLEEDGDETGFKGVHASKMKRVEGIYNKNRPSYSKKDERGPDGLYKIGLFMGNKLVDDENVQQDGEVVTVNMSFEQFAEMLVSTGHSIDCTIECVRGIGEKYGNYSEEIIPPSPIQERMGKRLKKVHTGVLGKIDEAFRDIDTWKTSKKVKLQAQKHLKSIRQDIMENTVFVAKQTEEEIGSVVESAVSIIADKIGALEKDGRLPKGSFDKFISGNEGQKLLKGS